MSILIKNGLVYDGTEDVPRKKDILIAGKKIAHLGDALKHGADNVIDATGAIVTPGFIDTGSRLDHYLGVFSETAQKELLSEGITTVIGGNGGISLAPFYHEAYLLLRSTGQGLDHKINFSWHSLKEFLTTLKKFRTSVNFGTLVGHTVMREFLTRGEKRDLTDSEISAMKRILQRCLKEGGLGLSLALDSFYSGRTSHRVIADLAGIVASENRILTVSLRDTGEKLKESLDEILQLVKETSVNVEINHFAPFDDFSDAYSNAVDLFEKISSESNVNFDLNPFGETALSLHKLLPAWFLSGNLEKIANDINGPAMKNVILNHLAKLNVSKIRILKVPSHLKFLEGKTLKEFAVNNGLDGAAAIMKFMQLTHLEASIAIRNIDPAMLRKFLVSAKSLIVSDGLNGAFLKFLEMADEEKLMPLQKTVAKITSLPAKKYRIPLRGFVKDGYYADLAVLKGLKPTHVILNGRLAFEEGSYAGQKAGMILKI